LLKEIVIAIDSYFRAHRFITTHRLWKWIVWPGVFYMILFGAGMYLFIITSGKIEHYIGELTGANRWMQQQRNALLSFIVVMGGIMVRLILLFFYFSLFKYLFLIIGAPVFAYLSEKTEALLEGKDFPFNFTQLLKDILRGIRISVRNALWQTVYSIFILIFSFIPVVGWITPVFALFIECYYYGFSMLDYSCERHKLSPAASVEFIGKHRGLAIGNGMLFYAMHIIPVLGWILAPSYAVVAATLSIYYQKKPL
jgi:CysZ protein